MSEREPGQDPHGRPVESSPPPGPSAPSYGSPPPGHQPPQYPHQQHQPPAYPPPGPTAPAHGGATEPQERNWAMAAHVGSFAAAYVALGLLAPLVVLLAKGNDSRFIRRHAVESLNFQISVLIYVVAGTAVAFVLTLATLGLGLILIVPIAIVLALAYVVVVVIATVRASHGEDYRYPLTLRLVT